MYDAETRAYQVQQEMHKRQNAYMPEASLGVYAFLRDVKKAGTKDFPYVFDEERAERFFAWAAMHKHTKGILAGQPIILNLSGGSFSETYTDGSTKIRDSGVLKKRTGK